MRRMTALMSLCGLSCLLPLARERQDLPKTPDAVEAEFAAVPFQEWAAQGPKAELAWHLRVSPPKLGLHQRMESEVEVEIDGAELAKHCCDGQAIALVEIKDSQAHIYRNFVKKDLKDAQAAMREYVVDLSWQVFLLPGEYQATVAFYYTGQTLHSLAKQNIRVEALKHDPLPESWRDLPSVEFCDPEPDGLDAFLLPNIEGRLNLRAKARRPIALEILANITPYPSERLRPRAYTDRLGVFLPVLKALAQMNIENGTLGLSLLDLSRKSIVFSQPGIEETQPSWSGLKAAMQQDSLKSVDVHNLAAEDHLGEFFRDEMTQRLNQAEHGQAFSVFIIVSGPMDLGLRSPIRVTSSALGHFALFYLKCDFPDPTDSAGQGRKLYSVIPPAGKDPEKVEDGVGKALKELKPRVFTVDSAQGVRQAMAAILADISRI